MTGTIEITCPICGHVGGLNQTHRHFVDDHLDLVQTEVDEETGKMQYLVSCPVCPLKYKHPVKPRYKDQSFLEEFKAEIALVAFDQLLYHLIQEHSESVGVSLQDIDDFANQERAEDGNNK